jgi:hypothetical protein
MRDCAPVALFVYNRLDHTRLTVEALRRNMLASQSDLVIFSDAAQKPETEAQVRAVREFIRLVDGFRSVTLVERERNFGLATSILDGVSRLCRERGRVIVLEDDLVTAPHFLTYMNDALDLYAGDDKIIAVHGYMFPVAAPLPETFFLCDPGCWGWATWERAWTLLDTDGATQWAEIQKQGRTREFDLDGSYDYSGMLQGRIAGKNQSWAILWYATAFLRGKLTLYPGRSLVQNIGFDGTGTHGGAVSGFMTKLSDNPVRVVSIPPEEDRGARAALVAFLKSLRKRGSLLARILHRVTVLIRTG